MRSIIEPSAPNVEPAGRQDLAQELVGAVLEERHLAGGDPVEGRLVRVVDADAQAGLGEGEAQRQADMAAAAEDDDVEVGGRSVMAPDSTSPVRDGHRPDGPDAAGTGQSVIESERRRSTPSSSL